ncbi:hypothetical protein [Tropicibacter sp. S64]|uniref:hypothetical protein n=1 Tax=Tropicibacter sp. S64 TaxID=3415122 RepID=UPI003C7C95D0
MIETWPTTLPRPFRDTYTAQAADALRLRQSDNGPPRLARRMTSIYETVALKVALDRYQRQVFDTFFKVTLKHGSLPFYMPDFTNDGWQLLDESGTPLVDENDDPLLDSATWLCQFGNGTPVETLQGQTFFKQFTLTVLP